MDFEGSTSVFVVAVINIVGAWPGTFSFPFPFFSFSFQFSRFSATTTLFESFGLKLDAEAIFE